MTGDDELVANKYSRQREAIREYLMSTKEHPTADTVYMNIRTKYPNISLGTVYRNLNLLAEKGEIIKVKGQDGCERYDANNRPHYHFHCNKCGRVFDIEIESIEHINEIAGRDFGGIIEGHVTFFYGKCPDCMKE